MAMVYRARDLMLERTVAIKILRKSYTHDPDFRERFRSEAKAAASLSHPNIVTVHDFGLDTDRLFIVMEYVPGTDLKKLLKERGRLPVDEALELMLQACAGIGHAHHAGLVHCDIKPQNILITPDNRVKVVDFGIARALSTIKEDEQVEVVWGSPQYFSPEQAAGGAPSPASDVYSLGVVLFEMLVGQVPFSAPSSEELARLHQETLPPSPRKLNPEIPPQLEAILLKVLAKEPAARYRTADQLRRVLTTIKAPVIEISDAITSAPTLHSESALQPPLPARTFSRQGEEIYLPARPPWKPAASYPPPPSKTRNQFDWVTWLLVLLALLAAGGLIPFWLWVLYRINPPL
jgi:eukaryotic-like serine/threonine-protein kinase